MSVSNILPSVPSTSLTSNGTIGGLVTLASTVGYVEGQRIQLSGTALPTLVLEVKRVNSSTQMIVGPTNSQYNAVQDISAYTTAASASILAAEQVKPTLDKEFIQNAEYQGGPVAGQRTLLVDSTGTPYSTTNLLPTSNIVWGAAQLNTLSQIRTSSQTNVLAMHNANGINGLFFNSLSVRSGTVAFAPNSAGAALSVSTTSGDSIIYQSRQYMPYAPGEPYRLTISGSYGTGVTNLRSRWGYFDANDGMMFQELGTVMSINTRTSTSGSPIDTNIPQSSWNLDTLDGSNNTHNPSGALLVPGNHTLYVFEYLWHGAGIIKFGVYINGNIIYCHQIFEGSTNPVPFMRTPSLPVRIELTNTGTSLGGSINYVCFAFSRENADLGDTHYTFTASNSVTSKTVPAANSIPLLSVQPATTFNGIANRVPILPQNMTLMVTNAGNIYVRVLLNATLTNASFATAGTNSSANVDTSATAISGGTQIAEFYVAGGSTTNTFDLTQLLPVSILGLDVGGTVPETITIAAQSLSGNATTVASIIWQENQ